VYYVGIRTQCVGTFPHAASVQRLNACQVKNKNWSKYSRARQVEISLRPKPKSGISLVLFVLINHINSVRFSFCCVHIGFT